jgi:hypothetical protein
METRRTVITRKARACALSIVFLTVLNACTAIGPGAKPVGTGQGVKPAGSGQGAKPAGSGQRAKPAETVPPKSPLFEAVAALDAAMFDAFNRCSDPKELQRHASYFALDVEFYHDEGGVTWKRAEMIANTKKNVCGKYRRELVAGTLKVFPLKNFGAIAQGEHRFCQLASGKCEGMADFVMVWRKRGNAWQVTRVLSFAHRPSE